MNSIVLELQQEVLNPDCDILNALRKAHIIAIKLNLAEFDKWIQFELKGYTNLKANAIPKYRNINGTLQAWNPYHGWQTVVFQSSDIQEKICTIKLSNSISEIIDLYNASNGDFQVSFPGDTERLIDQITYPSFPTNYRLNCGKHLLKAIMESVLNNLLEWTLDLEKQGILGENMQFSQEERTIAQNVPQQINYYGTVINGDVKQSQVVSGDHNTISFHYEQAEELLEKVKDAIKSEQLSEEDRDTAEELIEEAERKITSKKKPGIIKASLTGLKDFLIGAGANVAGALIVQYLQQL